MTANHAPRAGLREALSGPERVGGSRDAGTAPRAAGGRTAVPPLLLAHLQAVVPLEMAHLREEVP